MRFPRATGERDESIKVVSPASTPTPPRIALGTEKQLALERECIRSEPRSIRSRASRAYVLLVDNDDAQAQTLSKQLREQGITVAVAHNSAEALVRVATWRHDAVIIDAPVPRFGLALLAALRDLAPDLPAIVTSGFTRAHASFAIAVRSMGFHYVETPIQIEELITSLEDLVEP